MRILLFHKPKSILQRILYKVMDTIMNKSINKIFLLAGVLVLMQIVACAQQPKKTDTKNTTKNMEWNKLTKEEEDVIVRKGTEYPGTGQLLII